MGPTLGIWRCACCGGTNSGGAQFCEKCGTAAGEKTWSCGCGRENCIDSPFCSACGATSPSRRTDLPKEARGLNSETQPSAEQVFRLLSESKEFRLSEFAVVGHCLRFDEYVRNTMREWYERIQRAYLDASGLEENYLIWGSSGAGKTFFVEEIADNLGGGIERLILDLGELTRARFIAELQQVRERNDSPWFLCVDEIDAQPECRWPYDLLRPFLSLNKKPDVTIVCVLLGSTLGGLASLERTILTRHKGEDLISRIPKEQRWTVPEYSLADKLLVTLESVRSEGEKRGVQVRDVEKLALFHILVARSTDPPREFDAYVRRAVQRTDEHRRKLTYDDLFENGAESKRQQFWEDYSSYCEELHKRYVRILDSAH